MFSQVIMSQLCTAVYIICPHVRRAASSAAIRLFTQDAPIAASNPSMLPVTASRTVVSVHVSYCLFQNSVSTMHFQFF